MAIDNREKRQSALSAFFRLSIPSVTPNATKDQEWRQQVLWGYSGILAGDVTLVPDGPGLEYEMAVNRLHYTMPENRLHYSVDD